MSDVAELEQQIRNMHQQVKDLMTQIRERDDAMGDLRGKLADLQSYYSGRIECGDAHSGEKAAYQQMIWALNQIRGGSGENV